ncbi:WcaF family extracellular polysaccharide biosynthesis acetyltransferase [Cereibacter sphaeroides]|uniref:WcaF family extracellular polysaccharide biosynthesis acetyltransferase n=1 Tax=Cereibacter sphaeroides TaxID=1063 RepID=UPI003FCCF2F5
MIGRGQTSYLVRLDKYSSRFFERGASSVKEALWILFGSPLVASWVPGSWWRIRILRAYGAQIGVKTVWKPRVKVKFPWRLSVGDFSWIGEEVWIDNLAYVSIGNHACISQGVYFCTGSHDWSSRRFDLITKGIEVSDNAWVGAKSSIGPGTNICEGAVLAMGSVAIGLITSWTVHGGNPARPLRKRLVNEETLD